MPTRFRAPILAILPAALLLTACATGPKPYQPASGASSYGWSEQAIETGRYRVSYQAETPEKAREYALLRAAELTLQSGGEWFRVTDSYSEGQAPRGPSGRPAVSVGGSVGSGGRSSMGVGIGMGFPLGGGAGEFRHTLEILMGSGPKPQDVRVYDAADVQFNMAGAGG